MAWLKKIGVVLLVLFGIAVIAFAHYCLIRLGDRISLQGAGAAHELQWRAPGKPHIYTYGEFDDGPGGQLLTGARTMRSSFGGDVSEFVGITLIVSPKGHVIDAWPTYGNPISHKRAVEVAKAHTYSPFTRDGRPVYVKISEGIWIYPAERRPILPVPFPEVRNWNSIKVVLKRTSCLGTCPDYQVEIAGDGLVTYHGRSFVVVEGTHRAKVSPNAVHALIEKFRAADFFRLYPRYVAGITDNPTYILSIEIDGKKMQVVDYVGQAAGMPSVVSELEDEIDRIADTQRWIRTNSNTITSLESEGWNFKTNSCENRLLIAGVAEYGSPDLLSAILAKGVFPDKPCPRSSGYWHSSGSALQKAVERSNLAMVEMLLNAGAAVDKQELRLAIELAASNGNGKILAELLERLNGRVDGEPDRGASALTAAASSCVPEVTTQILAAGGDARGTDRSGQTALMAAALYSGGYFIRRRPQVRCDKTVLLLLKAGVDPWAVDSNGKTALDLARASSSDKVKEFVHVLENWMKVHPKSKK